MAKDPGHLERVGKLVKELEERGLNPVLVGGMALVILGSQRITKDFDFLISLPKSDIDSVIDIFYEEGFQLVSKLNDRGEVLRTIDNERVASIHLKLDDPASAYFFDWKARLKVDLLFDFPLSAREVAERAIRVKIKSHSLLVASPNDLLRLKEIAHADRQSAADAQDIEFLKGKK